MSYWHTAPFIYMLSLTVSTEWHLGVLDSLQGLRYRPPAIFTEHVFQPLEKIKRRHLGEEWHNERHSVDKS